METASLRFLTLQNGSYTFVKFNNLCEIWVVNFQFTQMSLYNILIVTIEFHSVSNKSLFGKKKLNWLIMNEFIANCK